MSELLSVFAALAAKSVSINGETPKVRDLGDLKNRLDTGDCPIRFLGEIAGDSFSLSWLNEDDSKSGNSIMWTIQDLLLLKPVGQGLGVRETMPKLATYAGAYAEMLREFHSPTANTELRTAEITVGRIEWPSFSNDYWMGVTCTLGIEERLEG